MRPQEIWMLFLAFAPHSPQQLRHAQTSGSTTGRTVLKHLGDEVVSVTVAGSVKAVTGVDSATGRFFLKDLTPGVYNLLFVFNRVSHRLPLDPRHERPTEISFIQFDLLAPLAGVEVVKGQVTRVWRIALTRE